MKSTLLGKNIKGSTFAHDLAPVTIFTGPNFRGKSTRIEAAQLALAGYVPGVSEKPRDIFDEFASGSQMEVQFFINEGVAACRCWEIANGKVKCSEACHECFESFPRVAIDYTEFFGLSGPERAKFLFARAKLPDSMTVEAFTRAITANLKNVKLEENTPATEAVLADLVRYVTERQTATPQDWLANLMVDSKVKLNAAVATAKRMESTLQGMTAVASETTVPADCEAKMAEARKALDDANKTRTTLQTELETCRREYRDTQAVAQRAVDERAARSRMDDVSKQKETLFKACQNPPSDTSESGAWQLAVDAFNRADNTSSFAAKEQERIEGELKHAESETTCPTCGQSTAAVKKKIVAALKKELKDCKTTAAAAAKHYDRLLLAKNEAETTLRKAQGKVAEHQKLQADYRKLSLEHADLQNRLAGTERAHEASLRLPELQERGTVLAGKLKDAETIANSFAAAYDAVALQVQQLNAERGKAQQRALVVEDCAKFRAEVAVLRELCKMLAELQAKLLEQVGGPLIASINSFCGNLLRAPLEYRDGEIGFVGTQYRHKTMSGTERTIFFAACSCALAQDAPVRMVTMDEFDIDEANWDKLVMLLSDLCAEGKLDLALLAHTTAPNVIGKNVKVIAL